MSILSVNTIIPFSNSNIEIESGSIQGNVIGTATTASYVQLQNVDGHTEFSQSVATALENTDSFPYTGSAAISGSLTFSSDSNFVPPKGTENQKPPNPEAGTFYYNTDTGNVEVYTGNIWAILNFENVISAGTAVSSTEVFDGEGKLLIADGGIITTYTSGGLNYQAHTFLTSDTLEVYTDITVDYLLVAGGGGGGNELAGGGGAGGVLNGSTSIASGSYDIEIGAGGGGAPFGDNDNINGSPGSNTLAIGLTAVGGGYGGGRRQVGGNGGSGGGSGEGTGGTGSSGTAGQGNNGGGGRNGAGNYPGGGGGGAGQAGQTPSNSNSLAGKGGDGIQFDLDGTNYYYAGGGGGSGYVNGGGNDGGAGGGGGGSGNTSGGFGTGGIGRNNGEDGQANSDASNNFPGGAGGTNTGGGGGGGAHSSGPGGNGGSGIVIIRYQV